MEKNTLDSDTKGEARKGKLILGLIGSPRKLGNCEVFVKEIALSVAEDCKLKLIRMPSLTIEQCLACYRCIMDQPCPQKDDMESLLQQIVHSDAIIIASPVYFLGSHSIIKRIIDRGFLFYEVLEKTYGKPCILINFYGMKNRIGVAPHTMMSFAAFLGLNIKANVNVKAALPGEVLVSPVQRNLAKKLHGLFLKRVTHPRTMAALSAEMTLCAWKKENSPAHSAMGPLGLMIGEKESR